MRTDGALLLILGIALGYIAGSIFYPAWGSCQQAVAAAQVQAARKASCELLFESGSIEDAEDCVRRLAAAGELRVRLKRPPDRPPPKEE